MGLSGHTEFTFEALALELSSNHSLVGSNKVILKRRPQKETLLHMDAQGKSPTSLAKISQPMTFSVGQGTKKRWGFFLSTHLLQTYNYHDHGTAAPF